MYTILFLYVFIINILYYIILGRYRNVTTATPGRMLEKITGCLFVGVFIALWFGHAGSQGKE